MSLLQNMGVNAIRVYTGIQPKWIQYIYETYGIYTMLNHSFGRYGLTLDGTWVGGAETEDVPVADRESTIRARYMYQLFNKAALAMKEVDPNHSVALCNGDLLFLDIIVKEAHKLDPYAEGTTLNSIKEHFYKISMEEIKTQQNNPNNVLCHQDTP